MSSRPRPDLDQIARYSEIGADLIPLHRWDAKGRGGRPVGKAPSDVGWRRNAYTLAQVKEHADAGGNVGWRLGPGDLVLDVDPRNFPEGRDPARELHAAAPFTARDYPKVVTGSGGFHIYMTKPPDLLTVDSLPDYPGVEFKSVGRQVVCAGSVHPSGKPYLWDDRFSKESPLRAPEALLTMIRRPAPVHSPGAGELVPEALTALLVQVPATEYGKGQHDRWLEVMMAAHHATGGTGREEFIEWCLTDPRYAGDAWAVGRRWDSLSLTPQRGGSPVTVRTLYRAVVTAGGAVPNTPPGEDFADPPAGGEAVPVTGRGVMDEMNERYCVVNDGGQVRVYGEDFDPVLNRHYFARFTKRDFELWMADRRVEVQDPGEKPKVVPVGGWWLSHPKRRKYGGVVFDPERQPDGKLNLWRGWSVEPRSGDWSALRDLVGEVLCDGDDDGFRYVMDWCAHMVQKPGSPAEVALVFRGRKGTGKGTFGRALVSLAGRHGVQVSSQDHLTGKFNAHLRDCVCLFADEAFWAGDKAGEGVLKRLVTEPTLVFEPKGRDVIVGRNTVHMIVASNAEWVVPAGLDGERRFAVFETGDGTPPDPSRFRRIAEQMDAGGLSAMLAELLARDVSGWHPRYRIPRNAALARQKVESMTPVEEWWLSLLRAGRLPGATTAWSEGPTRTPCSSLVGDFVDYARHQNIRTRRGPETRVGQVLSRLAKGYTRKRGSPPPADDVAGPRRVYYYVVPSLAECRINLDEELGSPIDWEPDEEIDPLEGIY